MVGSSLSWLRRAYQRMPFFVQCFLSYLLVMALLFSALFLFSRQASDIARQNYLNERRYALETSAQSFARQLDNFRAIPLSLHSTRYYRQLRLLSPDQIVNWHYYAMNDLRNSFSQQCSLLEMENNAFLYFQNSGAVLGTNAISFHAPRFFSEVIRFPDIGAERTVDALNTFSALQQVLPIRAAYGHEEPVNQLLFLYRKMDESAVYGLLLKEEALERLFRLDELPDGSQLQFLAGDRLLLSCGREAAEASSEAPALLESPLLGADLMVRLTIPNAYFTKMTAPLTAMNRTYTLLALCVGLALSALLSIFAQMPLRQLLRLSPKAAGANETKNEFLALSRSIQQSVQENRLLRGQIDNGMALLRLNLLARLLSQESYTASDEALAAEHLPALSRPSRILCLQLISSDQENQLSDFIAFHALEGVQKLFSPLCLMVQMRRDLFALLVGDDEKALALITEATAALQNDLNQYGVALAAGLSETFSALDGLHGAFLHAQFSLRYFSPPLSIFHPAEETEPFRFIDLSRFQNAVLGCEENVAQAQLDRLLDAAGHDAWVPQALHFILDSVCGEMNLPPADAGAPLRMRTTAVIRALSSQKDEYANTLVNTILVWLNENYADSSLSAESISSHFGVSKSYLYRAFRESLGLTPSEKLEQIRMAHANHLLLTTRMSVNSVAAACGYNSANTFYKAYKKCYNLSPNASRPAMPAGEMQETLPPA